MSENEESGKGKSKRRTRGVFERPAGSDIWWVRYMDENGRLHREKVGPKTLALTALLPRAHPPQGSCRRGHD